jgi:hypothetical protein
MKRPRLREPKAQSLRHWAEYGNALQLDPHLAIANNRRAWTYFKSQLAIVGHQDQAFALPV